MSAFLLFSLLALCSPLKEVIPESFSPLTSPPKMPASGSVFLIRQPGLTEAPNSFVCYVFGKNRDSRIAKFALLGVDFNIDLYAIFLP